MLCSQPFFKSSVDVSKNQALSSDASIPFPCGQCFHCRVNQARIWTQRLLLENMVSTDSVFVTLTYNDECIPWYGQLEKDEYQKYIKRVRKFHYPGKLRYFGIGEYGDLSYRPHYHIMFFSDNLPIDRESLTSCWTPRGFVQVGEVTKESARYIVGYNVAKLTKRKDIHVMSSAPEFMTCSKQNGGIGLNAIKVIADDLKKNKFWKPRVVNTLNMGKREIPIGRYLFQKLALELNTSPKQIIEDYYSHTNEYIENFYPEDSVNPFANYMKNFLDNYGQQRLSREKKFKIFKQRKAI